MNQSTQPTLRAIPSSPIARAVIGGLSKCPRRLPAWMLRDPRGSELYEQATELDTFYPVRIEREILTRDGAAIVAQALEGSAGKRPTFIELDAGRARQSELLVKHRPDALFVPTDLQAMPLALAKKRLARSVPGLDVLPFACPREDVVSAMSRLPETRVVLFLGSGIGRLPDRMATLLLRSIGQAAGEGSALVLGTDLVKGPSTMLPAYDDETGLMAAFQKNLLARMNRELHASFDLDDFEHVAQWDDVHHAVELALRSLVAQTVRMPDIGLTLHLAEGELVHTETHIKYDLGRVGRLLNAAGFERERTFLDARNAYAVHVARVLPQRPPQFPPLH